MEWEEGCLHTYIEINDFMIEIEVPENISALIEGDYIVVKGKLGSSRQKFNTKYAKIEVNGRTIKISDPENKMLLNKYARIETALSNEIKRSFVNVENGIERKMEIIYSHFPMSTEIKGKKFMIKNYLGRKINTSADIVGDTKIDVKGQNITVKGTDAYDVGQTVANIRNACKARGFDSRVFQDGIYVSREE